MCERLSTVGALQGLAVVITIITPGSTLRRAVRSVLILLEGPKGRNDGGWGGLVWKAGSCLPAALRRKIESRVLPKYQLPSRA